MKRKRNSRYNSTIGKLIFIVPIIVIGSLAVYAFIVIHTPGTLAINAESSFCPGAHATATGGSTCPPLNVQATVNGVSSQTPWTLSEPQGTYLVSFATVQGYYPPVSRDVTIAPSVTGYAVGLYVPIFKTVQVTTAGFNVSSIAVIHGVTPVNWTNPTTSAVTIRGELLGTITVQPGKSYTFVYQTAGTYTCTLMVGGLATDKTITIDAS